MVKSLATELEDLRKCVLDRGAVNDHRVSEGAVYVPAWDWVKRHCIPDCGNVILRGSEECSYLSGPQIQYTRSLCGTNSNGEFCYESIVDSINFRC